MFTDSIAAVLCRSNKVAAVQIISAEISHSHAEILVWMLVLVVAVLVVPVLEVTTAVLFRGMVASASITVAMAITLAEVVIAFGFGNQDRLVRQMGSLGLVCRSHGQGCRAQRWQVLGTRLLHVDIDNSGTVVHGMAER